MGTATAQDILTMKNKLIQISLDMAANNPWADISLYDIAKKADIPHGDAMALCPDTSTIFMAYGRQVDLKVAEAFDGESWQGMNEKDRLFDVLMERFDILNENRAGVISILNAITQDPKQMVCLSPMVCQSIEHMMRVAQVSSDGWKGTLKLTSLSGLYLKTLRDWVRDDAADMPATMASLDKGLGYFEKLNSF
jgi:hypothetical protein